MTPPVPVQFRQCGRQSLVDGGPAEVLSVGEQVLTAESIVSVKVAWPSWVWTTFGLRFTAISAEA